MRDLWHPVEFTHQTCDEKKHFTLGSQARKCPEWQCSWLTQQWSTHVADIFQFPAPSFLLNLLTVPNTILNNADYCGWILRWWFYREIGWFRPPDDLWSQRSWLSNILAWLGQLLGLNTLEGWSEREKVSPGPEGPGLSFSCYPCGVNVEKIWTNPSPCLFP